MTPPQPTGASSVRIQGLKQVGISAAVLLTMRLVLEWQMSTGFSSLKLPGIIFIIPAVSAAFGLTGAVTGSDKSWLRLPLVVMFSIALIGFTFWALIPRGYKLG